MRCSVEAYEPFPNVAGRNAIQERFEVPTLARLLRLPAGGDLLEVGCGRGVALAPLAAACRPSSLTAIDIDAALVSEARRTAEAAALEADVRRADVRDLPFADASFDLVVDFGTCYHIARPELGLAELERVLRSGGLLVHETPLAQLCSHPARFRGGLPWSSAPGLAPFRSALFWSVRRKSL